MFITVKVSLKYPWPWEVPQGSCGLVRQFLTKGNVDITLINSKNFINSPHY